MLCPPAARSRAESRLRKDLGPGRAFRFCPRLSRLERENGNDDRTAAVRSHVAGHEQGHDNLHHRLGHAVAGPAGGDGPLRYRRGALVVVIQVMMGAGMVVMHGFFYPRVTHSTALYITTGTPTLVLIPLGF